MSWSSSLVRHKMRVSQNVPGNKCINALNLKIYLRFSCSCPSGSIASSFCGGAQIWDSIQCICRCPTPPPAAGCLANYIWSDHACACILKCPAPTTPCPAPYVWSFSDCQCQCALPYGPAAGKSEIFPNIRVESNIHFYVKGCLNAQQWNNRSCVCECPGGVQTCTGV